MLFYYKRWKYGSRFVFSKGDIVESLGWKWSVQDQPSFDKIDLETVILHAVTRVDKARTNVIRKCPILINKIISYNNQYIYQDRLSSYIKLINRASEINHRVRDWGGTCEI